MTRKFRLRKVVARRRLCVFALVHRGCNGAANILRAGIRGASLVLVSHTISGNRG